MQDRPDAVVHRNRLSQPPGLDHSGATVATGGLLGKPRDRSDQTVESFARWSPDVDRDNRAAGNDVPRGAGDADVADGCDPVRHVQRGPTEIERKVGRSEEGIAAM